MGIFDIFPYTNLHELNLDWLIRTVKELKNRPPYNAIYVNYYADTQEWDLTAINGIKPAELLTIPLYTKIYDTLGGNNIAIICLYHMLLDIANNEIQGFNSNDNYTLTYDTLTEEWTITI